MEYRSTVVTFFFDLSQLEDANPTTRKADFYLQNGRNTLAIKNPMVIFCDNKYRGAIETIRLELAPGSATIYIEKPITEYDHYRINFPLLDKNSSKAGSRVNRSYYVLMAFKHLAMLIASQRNYFKTGHYVWIDFGCGHIAPTDFANSVKAILDSPRPKIGVCYIHYRSKAELDKPDFCNDGGCGVAGTVFSGEREYISKLYTIYMNIFFEQIEKNTWHCDEQVVTYAISRNPELFSIYYGDYKSVLVNYHNIQMDWHDIRYFYLENAIKAGDFKAAKACAAKLCEAFDNNQIKDISEGDKKIIKVLYESIESLFQE